MKGKRLIALLVVAVILSAALIGCAKTAPQGETETTKEATTEKEASKETSKEPEIKQYRQTSKGEFKMNERIAKKVANGEKLVIRFSTWDPAAPFFEDCRRGLKQLVDEIGSDKVDIAMVGPADGLVEKQIAELETIIASNQADALGIACGEADVIIPIFQKAFDKGIPVVAYDVDSANSPRLAFVGASHKDVGKMSAEALMARYTQKTGKIALFAAFPEGVYARERIEGLQNTLQENGYNLEAVGPFKLGLDMAEGYSVVESTYEANKDISIMYVADEYVVDAAEYVLKNNLMDKVLVIGVNTLPTVLRYVKDGIVAQTTGINPAGQAYMAANILYEFMTEGKTSQEITHVECINVDSSNIDEYMTE